MPKPWYAAQGGLKFECLPDCGLCCTGPEQGLIWTKKEERIAMAAQLGITLQEFEDRYTRAVGIRRSLNLVDRVVTPVAGEGDGSTNFTVHDCVLFDPQSRRCTVYDARPLQCRTFPFWRSNLKSPETWAKACAHCPGTGQGPLVPAEEVERQARLISV